MILNRGRHPSKIPYSEMYLICLKKQWILSSYEKLTMRFNE